MRRLVVMLQYSFIQGTQGNGYLIPELTSFEERSKRGCLDATITSTVHYNNFTYFVTPWSKVLLERL